MSSLAHPLDEPETTEDVTARLEALRCHVERSAALARDALERVERVQARLDARPYMAKDAYGVSGSLEGSMGFGPDVTAPEAPPPPPLPIPSFAELFRGPVEFITERQRVYVDLLRRFAPVLDLGCGRGEMLGLLAEAGIRASGVDIDGACVARCRRLGHDVTHADINDMLEGQPAHALGAIFSAQVIEHLTIEGLERMLALAMQRLRPGGMLIAETVNPESHEALKSFNVDPSHVRPLFPQVVLHLCREAGFGAARIFYPLGGGFTQTRCFEAGEYAVVARTPAAAPVSPAPAESGIAGG